jgi:hypothetical protein
MKIGLDERALSHVRLSELRGVEIYSIENGTSEICEEKLAMPNVCAGQVGITKICAREISLFERKTAEILSP